MEIRTHDGEKYLMAYKGDQCICTQASGDYYDKMLPDAGDLTDKTVAWIGGGFGVGVRMLSGCTQTVYEIESGLAFYCPSNVTFIPGDWQDTFSGTYDIIIYDIGGDVPYAKLEPHLNPGGKILPVDYKP